MPSDRDRIENRRLARRIEELERALELTDDMVNRAEEFIVTCYGNRNEISLDKCKIHRPILEGALQAALEANQPSPEGTHIENERSKGENT